MKHDLIEKVTPIFKPLFAKLTTSINSEQRTIIQRELIGYGVGVYDHKHLLRTLNFLSAAERRYLHEACVKRGRITLDMKLAVLRAARTGRIRESFRRCGMINDLKVWTLVKSCVPLLRAIRMKARKLILRSKDVPTPNQVRAECEKALHMIRGSVKGFVHAKMSFLSTSNNFEKRDFQQDLYAHATRIFYRASLFLSPAHVINSMKRGLRNHGLNIIMLYQSGKRRRLTADGNGGYVNNIQSYTLQDMDASEFTVEAADVTQQNEYEMVEMNSSIASLINRFRGKYRKALKIMTQAGSLQRKFLAWAKSQVKRRVDDIEDLHEVLGTKKYHRLVRQYVRASREQFTGFMQSLKEQLQPA